MRATALCALLLAAPAALTAAPEYIPVVNGAFSTGQWYFEGEESALGGNASLLFVPALRYSERFSLLPFVETHYRGTRSAEELAGGNTLFQDTWETGLGVKAVHRLGNKWKVKEKIGARMKLFRETTDENWTDGLYDYRILTIGGEVERGVGRAASAAVGYDFSVLQFQNYASLESGDGADFAREFSGEDVLDANVHLLSARFETPFAWRTALSLSGYHSPRFYTDQTVVLLSGELSSEKRRDRFAGADVGFDRTFSFAKGLRVGAGVRLGYASMDSNQNHYDARLTRFVAAFYDYDQRSAGTTLSVGFGRSAQGPMVVDAGFSVSRRDYRHRTIQAADGSYLAEKLRVTETATSLGFSYPLSRNLRARISGTVGTSRSNNDFEDVYRYNYDNANYQFGFTYDY